jgi:hypothetical protein
MKAIKSVVDLAFFLPLLLSPAPWVATAITWAGLASQKSSNLWFPLWHHAAMALAHG